MRELTVGSSLLSRSGELVSFLVNEYIQLYLVSFVEILEIKIKIAYIAFGKAVERQSVISKGHLLPSSVVFL